MADRAALKHTKGVEVSVKLIGHRFDIAEKLIEIRGRDKLRSHGLGTVHLDGLNGRGALDWTRGPQSVHVAIPLGSGAIDTGE